MCTLAFRFRPRTQQPLVVAANRDERRARPATGPFVWPGTRFLAPRDEMAGGSWLGVNDKGVFVGITNRHPPMVRADRVSRGALVLDALGYVSARSAARGLVRLAGDRHNAFHLVTVDSTDAFVTWSDGESVRQTQLEPGLHVVTERSYGAADNRPRADRVRALWPDDDDPRALMRMLGERHTDADPFASVCVDVPDLDYGTRSSFIYASGPSTSTGTADARMWWSEGQPTPESFVERTELLEMLRPRP